MKKWIFAAALTVMVSSAQAAFPIEGSWGTQMDNNGVHFDLTFTFANNAVTLVNVCSVNGKSLKARVSSPAVYDASSVTIFNPSDDSEHAPDGSMNCEASVQGGRMNYQVQGNLLILSQDGSSQQFALTKK